MAKKDKQDRKKHRKKRAAKARPERSAEDGGTRSLCKWDESIYADAARMADAGRGATHVCRKCGRAANEPRLLCKPLPLADA